VKFLVHTCLDEHGELSRLCACHYWIGRNEIDARVASGELAPIGKRGAAPRRAVAMRSSGAAKIGKTHIERAYLGTTTNP